MKLFLTCVIGLCLGAGTALAQVAQDARAVLEQAAEAMRASGGGRAVVRLTGEAESSFFKDILPSAECSLVWWRGGAALDDPDAEPTRPALRLTGAGKQTVKADQQPIDALVRADLIATANPAKKLFTERNPGGKVHSDHGLVREIMLDWLIEPEPFTRELGMGELSMGEPIKIGGVSCVVVVVRYPKPPEGKKRPARFTQDVAKFAFAESDHLPRRIDLMVESAMGSLTKTIELNNFTSGGVEAGDVAFEPPEGYRVDSPFRTPEPKPEPTNANNRPRPTPTAQPIRPTQPERPTRPAAPVWELVDTGDRIINGQSQRGRVTVLYFWGSWSSLCDEASPMVGVMGAALAQRGVDVLAVGMRERVPGTAAEALGQPSLIVCPEGDATAGQFGVHVVPSFVVIDADGRLATEKLIAFEPEKTVEELVAAVEKVVRSEIGQEEQVAP